MKWCIGGPSYQLQVDSRHAINIAQIARALGSTLHGIQYRHGTLIDVLRSELFADALSSDIDFLYQMDSDVFGMEPELLVGLSRTLLAHHKPMVGFPCPLRDGSSSIWLERGKRLKHQVSKKSLDITPCFATGTGAVLYNLAWYREKWPADTAFFKIVWDEQKMKYSEDIYHCNKLEELFSTAFYSSSIMMKHANRGV